MPTSHTTVHKQTHSSLPSLCLSRRVFSGRLWPDCTPLFCSAYAALFLRCHFRACVWLMRVESGLGDCMCVCWVKADAVWPTQIFSDRPVAVLCFPPPSRVCALAQPAINIRNTHRNVAAISHPSECSLISGIMNQSLLYGSHIEQICLKVISLFYAWTALRMLAWTHFTDYKNKCHLDYSLGLITYMPLFLFLFRQWCLWTQRNQTSSTLISSVGWWSIDTKNARIYSWI